MPYRISKSNCCDVYFCIVLNYYQSYTTINCHGQEKLNCGSDSALVTISYLTSLRFIFNSQRLRPTIHDIITTKIKGHAERVNYSRAGVGQAAETTTTGLHYLKGQLESFQLSKQKRQNGISLAGMLLAVSPVSPVMAPMGTAQAAAKELLNLILDTVVRIFGEM